MHERIIFFNDVVDRNSAGHVVAEMIHLANQSKEPIHFYINSPGGSVIDGLSIIDTMKILPCDVYTYGIGMQASMGSLLLVCGKKGYRRMLKNSFVMIHSISTGMGGKLPDIEEDFKFTVKLKDILTDLYVQNTKITKDEIESIFKSPDRWFDSKEAIEKGIVDGII